MSRPSPKPIGRNRVFENERPEPPLRLRHASLQRRHLPGRAVANHNPGADGDEINSLCDNVKTYLAQRQWVINNPDVSIPYTRTVDRQRPYDY